MREERIDFQQCSDAFVRCGKPERLQEQADSLSSLPYGQKWIACLRSSSCRKSAMRPVTASGSSTPIGIHLCSHELVASSEVAAQACVTEEPYRPSS
jgi:hypothetical protein